MIAESKEVKEWNLDINLYPDQIEALVLSRPQIINPRLESGGQSTLNDTNILRTIVH